MPTPGAPRVEPFSGDWNMIDPPVGFADLVNGKVTDKFLYPLGVRIPLAVSVAGHAYLYDRPDERAVTLLSHVLQIPRPGKESDARYIESTMRSGISLIGHRVLTRYQMDLEKWAAHDPENLVQGELPSPTALYASHVLLRSRTAALQELHPNGLVYTTYRNTNSDNLTVGWCDPLDGRRSQIDIDLAPLRIRQMEEGITFDPVYG